MNDAFTVREERVIITSSLRFNNDCNSHRIRTDVDSDRNQTNRKSCISNEMISVHVFVDWLIVSNTSKHSSITLQCFFLVTNRLNRYWVHSLHSIEERINEYLHSPLSFFVSIETFCHSWSISLSISFQNYSLWGASNPKTPVRTWNEKPTIKSSLWFHLIVSIP